MNSEKGFIKYIFIVIVILVVVFLSQQPRFGLLGKNVFSQGIAAIQGYWAKGSNWVTDKVYPSISGEVQKRGDMVKEGIVQEKEKVSESVGEKIKNYFSGVIDSITGKNKSTNNDTNCQSFPDSAK